VFSKRVLVYEFITGGGCWSLGDDPPAGSLLAEGMAMRNALASDLARVDSVAEIHLLHDSRLRPPQLPSQVLHPVTNAREELRVLAAISRQVEAVIVIAPEFGQLLWERSQLVESVNDQLLSPAASLVRLCSDKQQTCKHLAAQSVPAARGIVFSELSSVLPSNDLFPAVLKPNDGAGSQFVQLLATLAEIRNCDLSAAASWRLEQFHPGTPVSVSLLAGPRGFIALQPCTQNLSDNGRFTYRGCTTPLPLHLAERAERLALAAAATLPPAKGYLGIDMVLGSAENGSQDVVIEINPRLTTSYLVLRQACEQNLAAAMLKWAAGETIELSWRPTTIEYSVPCQ
jgi:predicted ATP-grasp superfamily ATP-dependent carboligase